MWFCSIGQGKWDYSLVTNVCKGTCLMFISSGLLVRILMCMYPHRDEGWSFFVCPVRGMKPEILHWFLKTCNCSNILTPAYIELFSATRLTTPMCKKHWDVSFLPGQPVKVKCILLSFTLSMMVAVDLGNILFMKLKKFPLISNILKGLVM
jgi:hypothetical protein